MAPKSAFRCTTILLDPHPCVLTYAQDLDSIIKMATHSTRDSRMIKKWDPKNSDEMQGDVAIKKRRTSIYDVSLVPKKTMLDDRR